MSESPSAPTHMRETGAGLWKPNGDGERVRPSSISLCKAMHARQPPTSCGVDMHCQSREGGQRQDPRGSESLDLGFESAPQITRTSVRPVPNSAYYSRLPAPTTLQAADAGPQDDGAIASLSSQLTTSHLQYLVHVITASGLEYPSSLADRYPKT